MGRRNTVSPVSKLIGIIVTLIIVAGLIFCLTALIQGTINNIGFVEQIKNWFGVVENIPEVPEEDVSSATALFMNLI